MGTNTASRGPSYSLPVLVGLVLIASGAAQADTYTFTAVPADVSGPAGSTVGWGYSITNQSTADWLVPTDLSAGVFENGTPESLFDFPAVAPGVTVTVDFDFDPVSPVGLYELTWDATAPAGFVDSGSFDLQAEWWDNDPAANGNLLGDAPEVSAAYSATVSGSLSVPEPSSLGLCVLIAGLVSAKKVKDRLSAVRTRARL